MRASRWTDREPCANLAEIVNPRHILISTALGVTVGLTLGLTLGRWAGFFSGDTNESPSPPPVRSAEVPAATAETRSGGSGQLAIEPTELEAIRKKRAGKIRLVVIVVVGGLYAWYMQRALSGIL